MKTTPFIRQAAPLLDMTEPRLRSYVRQLRKAGLWPTGSVGVDDAIRLGLAVRWSHPTQCPEVIKAVWPLPLYSVRWTGDGQTTQKAADPERDGPFITFGEGLSVLLDPLRHGEIPNHIRTRWSFNCAAMLRHPYGVRTVIELENVEDTRLRRQFCYAAPETRTAMLDAWKRAERTTYEDRLIVTDMLMLSLTLIVIGADDMEALAGIGPAEEQVLEVMDAMDSERTRRELVLRNHHNAQSIEDHEAVVLARSLQ